MGSPESCDRKAPPSPVLLLLGGGSGALCSPRPILSLGPPRSGCSSVLLATSSSVTLQPTPLKTQPPSLNPLLLPAKGSFPAGEGFELCWRRAEPPSCLPGFAHPSPSPLLLLLVPTPSPVRRGIPGQAFIQPVPGTASSAGTSHASARWGNEAPAPLASPPPGSCSTQVHAARASKGSKSSSLSFPPPRYKYQPTSRHRVHTS